MGGNRYCAKIFPRCPKMQEIPFYNLTTAQLGIIHSCCNPIVIVLLILRSNLRWTRALYRQRYYSSPYSVIPVPGDARRREATTLGRTYKHTL